MKTSQFGRLDGRRVEEATLRSAEAEVRVLGYGAIVRDWRVDGDGRTLPAVLGFGSLEDYVRHSRSHGIVAGRVANRTANGRFELEGKSYQLTPNEGPHHLHGGAVGLGRRLWEMDTDASAEAVHLRYFSPDGEEGYPGAVEFRVTYRLEGMRLVVEMSGAPDRPTPINLAQHNYYNLGGGGDVLDHRLWVAAEEYTETDAALIPTGRLAPVEGTALDFRAPRAIGEAAPEVRSLDDNLVLDAARDPSRPSATVECPRTGLTLRLWTREPGLQVFNAATQSIAAVGHDRARYGAFSGLCLEAQHFPDSLHHPDWPSILRTPEAPYFQRLEVEIGPS